MQSAATAEKGRPDETTDELDDGHCDPVKTRSLAATARALMQRHMHACAQSSWPAPGPAARHMMHLLGKKCRVVAHSALLLQHPGARLSHNRSLLKVPTGATAALAAQSPR